ncbi:hypothetical protein KCP73_16390 [Salmonella enterica subsp. enterica]|nr:hypothetical protein KCP73_16390 [Salmonella enterica subsp. enterica]
MIEDEHDGAAGDAQSRTVMLMFPGRPSAAKRRKAKGNKIIIILCGSGEAIPRTCAAATKHPNLSGVGEAQNQTALKSWLKWSANAPRHINARPAAYRPH